MKLRDDVVKPDGLAWAAGVIESLGVVQAGSELGFSVSSNRKSTAKRLHDLLGGIVTVIFDDGGADLDAVDGDLPEIATSAARVEDYYWQVAGRDAERALALIRPYLTADVAEAIQAYMFRPPLLLNRAESVG